MQKFDSLNPDFYQCSGLFVYTLSRNFWCGEGKGAIKNIICLCMRHGRSEEHLFFNEAHERPLSGGVAKNIEEVLQLQSFSAECPQKRPEIPGERKITFTVNINCQKVTCWEALLVGTRKCSTFTGVEGSISSFLLLHAENCFFPFPSDTQSTYRHFKVARAGWFITIILTPGFIVIKVISGWS